MPTEAPAPPVRHEPTPPHEENSVSNVADNSQSDTLQSDNVVLGPIALRCLYVHANEAHPRLS